MVTLNKRGIKDDLAHGMSMEKAASFAAVPEVICQGQVVAYESDWKNRGYDTATIAAPIKIDSEPYMMAVVVRRSNQNNQFYVYDVFAEKEATPFNRGRENGLPGGVTSTISIIDHILDVKRNLGKNGHHERKYSVAESDRAYMEAVEAGDGLRMRELVDEAAQTAGYNINLYHGTAGYV